MSQEIASSFRLARSVFEAETSPPRGEKNIETLSLTSEEEEVLALLAEPMPRDELLRELGIPTGTANVLLAQMELRGLIAESLGNVRKLV